MKVIHLITTACVETWPTEKDQPVLFLGEWCKVYNARELWKQFNSETSPYHWDDRKKLHSDYQAIQETYEKTLIALSEQLNIIHQVNYSERYWRILIGPWLEYFIHILFDRWFMLKQTIEKDEIIECNVIERNPISMVPSDMTHFTKLFTNDDWNEAIYGQLLGLSWSEVVNIKKIQTPSVDNKCSEGASLGLKATVKRNVKNWIPLFNKLFPKDDGYFFISSYLPLKTNFKLQIRLGQFPKLWRSEPAPVIKAALQKRRWRLDEKVSMNDSFEDVVRQLIPLHIPTAYLEGYEQLVTTANLLPWPKNPKAIFTSNSYAGDDLFKVWAANKIEIGVPLIIGQHGGGYGTSMFLSVEEHQVKIADKWLSWGWSDQDRENIVPIGYWINTINKFKINYTGDALMVECIIPRYSYRLYASPIAGQWLDYFNDQKLFLSKLSDSIKKKTALKLGGSDYGWDQVTRWQDEMPELLIHSNVKSIKKLIQSCRICIATYNSTTFLEAFAMNVPTIMFWNPNHWEINSTAQPYYDKLKSVGIFHETPESAANQMTKVWDDVGRWWLSESVQNAKNDFCKQYSRNPENSLKELHNFFHKY